MSTWPPTVDDVQVDIGIGTDVDPVVLATELAAAIAYVQRVRSFNYTGDPLDDRPAPTDDVWLGTVRLARRWHDRRRSSTGQIYLGDTGTDSVPYTDPDIAQLLGIGRFRRGAFA